MKKIKMILLSIVGILVLFIGFGLIMSNSLKSIQIVTTVVVKGTQQEVFDMVKHLNNFPKWSPFIAQDPGQKYEIKGVDGAVGAQYHWNGRGGKDIGHQEIVKIDELKHVGMQCDIKKPFEAKPTFDYYFTETPNGIEVKQDFKVKSGTVAAFFMWLGGAKKEMEKTNQQGMDLLKKAVESKK